MSVIHVHSDDVHAADLVPSLKGSSQRARSNASELKWFIWKERQSELRTDVPFRQRLARWRRGFVTSSGILYDFDTYDAGEFINDVEHFRRTRFNEENHPFTTHKVAFRRMLGSTHRSVLPRLYGVIRNGAVEDEEGQLESTAVEDWLRAEVRERGRVVIKPENGVQGDDVFVVAHENGMVTTNGESGLAPVRDAVASDRAYVVVEYVRQAGYADSIYPYATNTVRLLTLWDYERNEPFVADAIHRFGTDDSRPVDNWNKGGLSALIDLDTGTLGRATRYPDSIELEWFETHPDTGASITGVEIRDWDSIVSGVLEMAERLWFVPILGWDIVSTADGFKVIEANARVGVETLQVHRPLLRDDRTRRFFEHHGILS